MYYKKGKIFLQRRRVGNQSPSVWGTFTGQERVVQPRLLDRFGEKEFGVVDPNGN